MRSNLVNLIIGLGFTTALAACVYENPNSSSADLSPKQTCVQIKRQMMYNRTNNNVEAEWFTAKQRTALEHAFSANNCSAVLSGKA